MEKFSFGNFTGETEQGLMCGHRPAHGNHPCWPWKMNVPIFFKMVQNNVTWHLIRKLWRHIMSSILPLLVHLKNRPGSDYVIMTPSLWKHANIGSEEREDEATEVTTVLPVSTILTYTKYSHYRFVFSKGAKKNKANKTSVTYQLINTGPSSLSLS